VKLKLPCSASAQFRGTINHTLLTLGPLASADCRANGLVLLAIKIAKTCDDHRALGHVRVIGEVRGFPNLLVRAMQFS